MLLPFISIATLLVFADDFDADFRCFRCRLMMPLPLLAAFRHCRCLRRHAAADDLFRFSLFFFATPPMPPLPCFDDILIRFLLC